MILNIKKVTKQFKDTKALNGIDLKIPKGKIFGLLGPNGAGKTTLIRIITQILKADSGSIAFDGDSLDIKHTENIGYLPEERGLYLTMKVKEQVKYLASLKGIAPKEIDARINEFFARFGAEEWVNKKVSELSKGMQQKVQFISTILHNPNLIILDEPFTGLDPINTMLIKDEIQKMRDNGVSIIFSTHRMEQVEEMCEEIALINKGKIVINGDVTEIKHKYKENLFEVHTTNEIDQSQLTAMDIVKKEKTKYFVKPIAEGSTNDILKQFMNLGTVTYFAEILPSLNEIFIKLVGGSDE